MVWRASDPEGAEATKVRFDVLPYIGHNGFDLGCGPHKVYPHFVGLDSCVDTRLFGTPMQPDLVVPNCAELPMFAPDIMDTVFSSHLLEHIVDYKSALREWWRVLKADGHLILYLPHADLYPNIGQPGANPDHKHDFRPEDIIAAMEEVAGDWDLLVNETRGQGREYSFLQVYRKRAAGAGQTHSWRNPVPDKRAAIVRPGAYGDALWASSPAAALKAEGYHVTVYTGEKGMDVLSADPNIDRLIEVRLTWLTDADWLNFYRAESAKYDRWVNLIGVVETRLLAHPSEYGHQWSPLVRHRRMNRNYLEAIHEHAEVPPVFRQRFYPTADELAWARDRREKNPGPLVVVAPFGSGEPKTWPYAQRFMELMNERRVRCVVVGEPRQNLRDVEPYAIFAGELLPVRHAMTLATIADVVIGTETALINAVAQESNLKVVLLMHSSPENLTKHWTNTIAIEPKGAACHPCHQLHNDMTYCTKDAATGFAACQSLITAEQVAAIIAPTLDALQFSANRMAAD